MPGYCDDVPVPPSPLTLDVFPLPLMVLDDNACILHMNHAAEELVGQELTIASDTRCGAVLRCARAFATPEGCGLSEKCPECVLRNTVTEVYRTGKMSRRPARVELSDGDDGRHAINILVTASALMHDGRMLVLMMLEDIPELVNSAGLLPVCAHCGKMKSQDGMWLTPERFLQAALSIHVSHGLCPGCRETHYPEVDVPAERDA